jgi:hypothetical protein
MIFDDLTKLTPFFFTVTLLVGSRETMRQIRKVRKIQKIASTFTEHLPSSLDYNKLPPTFYIGKIFFNQNQNSPAGFLSLCNWDFFENSSYLWYHQRASQYPPPGLIQNMFSQICSTFLHIHPIFYIPSYFA